MESNQAHLQSYEILHIHLLDHTSHITHHTLHITHYTSHVTKTNHATTHPVILYVYDPSVEYETREGKSK